MKLPWGEEARYLTGKVSDSHLALCCALWAVAQGCLVLNWDN